MSTIDPENIYDVAVILVNYNSSQYTVGCISSIIDRTDPSINYGIVVVDNASEPDDYEALKSSTETFDNRVPLKLFRSRINTGFASGNMMGIQFIKAKYYFILNNDCRLQNDCLGILYDFCEHRPDTALCSPQLYNEKDEHQPCFDYFPYITTKIFGLGILSLSYGKRYIKRKDTYETPVQVDVVSGSQMFVRASVFDTLGGLDTSFFLYCEEEDFAMRVANAGFETWLVPEAKNTHKGGGSTVPSLAIRKEFYISFLYFYRKHFVFIKQQLLKLILTLRLLRKGIGNMDNMRLAAFVASGAHMKHSLKQQQTVKELASNL